MYYLHGIYEFFVENDNFEIVVSPKVNENVVSQVIAV